MEPCDGEGRNYSVWECTFIPCYEAYLLYAMGIVFGPIMFFTQDGAVRWLGLASLLAGAVLPVLQISYFYRKTSRMTQSERNSFYRLSLAIHREKEDLGM